MIFSQKARTLGTVLVCGISLSLTGCHGGKDTAAFSVPESLDTDKNYEITFWAKNDTNATQVKVYQKAISDFEKLYPNIKVNLKTYTDYGAIYNDVITNIATATTPNVCITYPDHIATYLTGENVVVPLDELMTDSKYGFGGSEVRYDSVKYDEVVAEFLEEGKIGSQHYALPYMRSTEVCYVNKDYVEKLGYELPKTLTWDFVWEVSEAAINTLQSDGTYSVNNQKVLIPFIYKSTDNMMISLLKQLDAGYSDADGNILIFNDTTTDLLKNIYSHGKTKAFSTFAISSYPANFLNAGQCIFAVDSTAGSTWMGTDAPLVDIADDKLAHFETVVMTIPQTDTENPQMISQGPSICVFNKEDSGEVLASWLFAQYMLTNEVQIGYSKTEGYIPVTHKAQDSAEYQDYLSRAGEDNAEHYSVKLAASKLLIENTSNTFVTPVFNGSASLRTASGQLIEEVVKAARRKQEVDYEKLYKDITSLYRLDQKNLQGDTGGKTALGKLPTTSVVLLVSLISVWCLIIVYIVFTTLKAKKKK